MKKADRMSATQKAPGQTVAGLQQKGGAVPDSPLRVLVLGRRAGVPGTAAPSRPPIDGFHFAVVGDLCPDLLAAIDPDLILSPLMVGPHDVIDIARMLAELGFAGRYRALAVALPRPDIVMNEVRSVAPRLDFDLFIVGPGPNEATN